MSHRIVVLPLRGCLALRAHPIITDLPAHASYMVGFGIVGYWAEVWEVRSNELIAQKRDSIRRMRGQQIQTTEMRDED